MSEEDKKWYSRWWGMPLLFSVITAFVMVMGFGIYCSFTKWELRGQFGDMFGAVNALISGLAFGAFIITLNMQREELRLQREEFSKARAANEAQASSQAEQVFQMEIASRLNALAAQLNMEVEIQRVKGHLSEHDYKYNGSLPEINQRIKNLQALLDPLHPNHAEKKRAYKLGIVDHE